MSGRGTFCLGRNIQNKYPATPDGFGGKENYKNGWFIGKLYSRRCPLDYLHGASFGTLNLANHGRNNEEIY